MAAQPFDVVVLGCGPSGQQAAVRCASAGRSVALVDEREVVGGQCLHVGTIPSKTLRAAILHASGYYERAIFGEDHRGHGTTHAELMLRLRSVVGREVEVIQRKLEGTGVRVVRGRGRLIGPHLVEVRSQQGEPRLLEAGHLVVATGTRSVVPEVIPVDGYHVLNTDQVLQLPLLPRSLQIVGGGVVGLEYACMFGLLDIPVHVITRYTELLPWVDRDLLGCLLEHMERHNVTLHTGRTVSRCTVLEAKRVDTVLDDGTQLETQMMFYAGSRLGATRDLGLAELGVRLTDRDLVVVDANYRSAVPWIYAVGDVIGFPSLAATAIDQGRKAANHLVGLEDVPIHPMFPYGLYTIPDISMVGRTEADLQREVPPPPSPGALP